MKNAFFGSKPNRIGRRMENPKDSCSNTTIASKPEF
jgi:hypothetical protein